MDLTKALVALSLAVSFISLLFIIAIGLDAPEAPEFITIEEEVCSCETHVAIYAVSYARRGR